MHYPVRHQGIAEEPTLEDSLITHDALHPSFTGEPGSTQSTSGNVNSAEPNKVTQPPDHLRRWTKDHPLDNIVGNPSRVVSTRKQLISDALWCCYHTELSKVEPKNFKMAYLAQSMLCEMRALKWIYKVGNLDEYGGIVLKTSTVSVGKVKVLQEELLILMNQFAPVDQIMPTRSYQSSEVGRGVLLIMAKAGTKGRVKYGDGSSPKNPVDTPMVDSIETGRGPVDTDIVYSLQRHDTNRLNADEIMRMSRFQEQMLNSTSCGNELSNVALLFSAKHTNRTYRISSSTPGHEEWRGLLKTLADAFAEGEDE
ncbi:hypothetical protein Tco_1139164 [Tanacetum coccineum]